jgi:hypothetical protein
LKIQRSNQKSFIDRQFNDQKENETKEQTKIYKALHRKLLFSNTNSTKEREWMIWNGKLFHLN